VALAADGAYAGGELQSLPPRVSVVTAVRKDAALHELPPPPTGRPGRPRLKGDALPKLEQLAYSLTFTPATVTRYGHTGTAYVATRRCLWPTVFGYTPATLVLVRNKPGTPRGGYDKALITPDTTGPDTTGAADSDTTEADTDPDTTDTAVPDTATRAVEGYAGRWSEEVAIRDSKQIIGVGQAHNRTKGAVEHTVPFGLACQVLLGLWYATAGYDPADVAAHRERAPWYTGKAEPSTADMHAKLRRTLLATRFRSGQAPEPTPAELHAIQLAWRGGAEAA
jgi:hypothetical protein